LVAIDGKLTRRSYTSRDGKTAYVTEIVIESINAIGSKKDNPQDQQTKKQFVDQKPVEIKKEEVPPPVGEVN
jgi:single-strand DNA-binding protein